jgi:hypothetical protein
MQVLKDQQERLYLAVAQQEPLQGREGALTALGRVQVQKGTVLWQRLQERQQRRKRLLESLIQR